MVEAWRPILDSADESKLIQQSMKMAMGGMFHINLYDRVNLIAKQNTHILSLSHLLTNFTSSVDSAQVPKTPNGKYKPPASGVECPCVCYDDTNIGSCYLINNVDDNILFQGESDYTHKCPLSLSLTNSIYRETSNLTTVFFDCF